MASEHKSSVGIDGVSSEPWYRQFWPWFLIALPTVVVCASLYTLVLAIRYSDPLVSDNYYRDGLAINERLSQDEHARALGLSARIEFAGDGETVGITLSASAAPDHPDLPDVLTLLLLHPTDAHGDRALVATAVGAGVYRGHLAVRPTYRFYLRLLPSPLRGREAYNSAAWRLNGEINFAQEHTSVLGTGDTLLLPEKGTIIKVSDPDHVR